MPRSGGKRERWRAVGGRDRLFCGIRSEGFSHRRFSKRIIDWPLLDSDYVGYVGEAGWGPRGERASHYSEYAGQYPKRYWPRHVLSERFRVEIRDTVRTGFRLYGAPGRPPERAGIH